MEKKREKEEGIPEITTHSINMQRFVLFPINIICAIYLHCLIRLAVNRFISLFVILYNNDFVQTQFNYEQMAWKMNYFLPGFRFEWMRLNENECVIFIHWAFGMWIWMWICTLQIVTMLKYLIDRRWWLLPLQRISLIAPVPDSWYIFFLAHFFHARTINEHHSFPVKWKLDYEKEKKKSFRINWNFSTLFKEWHSFVTLFFIGSEKDSKFEWFFFFRPNEKNPNSNLSKLH